MGHGDSSAQLGGPQQVRLAGCRVRAAATRPEVTPARRSRPRSRTVRLLLAALRFYQCYLSPLMPSACKFYPSCSHYAYEAIELHGYRRGTWLAVRRLLRCRPFVLGGLDPVPDADRAEGARL
ncbi:MAG TPA: membrane protein insertion efficiency factor YidD [Candidatus Acidoferrales bacterium]|nr:membrane protein insertion efficiency factor YidD [Candidatus Acidoferrales bacterium]